MRYLKMLALAAVAAGALMAFIGASTASASVLCSTTVDPCPVGQDWPANTVLDFSVASGAAVTWDETGGERLNSCTTSTMKGKISKTGGSTETVTGPVEETTWGSCTFPTKTLTKAALEVHRISGTSNGTVTADGTFEVTFNHVILGSCIYGITSGVSLGDITEGNPAVLHLNAIVEKHTGSSLACPSTAKLLGTYTLTSPSGTTTSVSSS